MEKNEATGGEKSLKQVIRALCADFERRCECVENGTVSRRVRMEYVYLNSRMLDAAYSVCGSELGRAFIKDLGDGVGYAKSPLADSLSESTYKRCKEGVVMSIAHRLHLADK